MTEHTLTFTEKALAAALENVQGLGYLGSEAIAASVFRRLSCPEQAPDGFLLITPDQVERHATTAWECPPQSRVVLVSSLKRLHAKNAAAPAQGAQHE